MIALALLTHEPAPRVARMVEFWQRFTSPKHIVVVYGGPAEEFEKISSRKVFVDDPRLRTNDHQRERQSYTEVLSAAMGSLESAEWEWLYLAEYDMLPVDREIWRLLSGRADAEKADLLGYRMWRIDNTLHPHYASHLATPEWIERTASLSCRAKKNVILSCMGCGQFWRRGALQAVLESGESVPAYLELQLPTFAHHLGYRVRGMANQDQFISNVEIPGATVGLARDLGAWVYHPQKNLWSGERASDPLFETVEGKCLSTEIIDEPPVTAPAETVSINEQGWDRGSRAFIDRLSCVASGWGELRIVHGGSRLAVALPQEKSAARLVARLYQPHRWKGKLFSIYLKSRVSSSLGKSMTVRDRESKDMRATWLSDAVAKNLVGFIGGNPVHGQRCVLGGYEDLGGQSPFVAKLGFDQSKASIIREAKLLRQLYGRYRGVLRPESLDVGEDWALLKLPYIDGNSIRKIDSPSVLSLLAEWRGGEKRKLGDMAWSGELLDQAENVGLPSAWCQRMRGTKIKGALVHGDFAVWNLRETPLGLCAIDWEWGVEKGIAGIDLAHGLRQEATMIRGKSGRRAIDWILSQASSRSWRTYLWTSGWDVEKSDWLALGLLHTHFNTNISSMSMLEALSLRD